MYVSITGRGTHFRLSLTCLISYHTIRHQHSATPHPNLHISRTSPYQARRKAWVQVEGGLQSPHTHTWCSRASCPWIRVWNCLSSSTTDSKTEWVVTNTTTPYITNIPFWAWLHINPTEHTQTQIIHKLVCQ